MRGLFDARTRCPACGDRQNMETLWRDGANRRVKACGTCGHRWTLGFRSVSIAHQRELLQARVRALPVRAQSTRRRGA